MLGLSRLSASPSEARLHRQAPRAVATRSLAQVAGPPGLQQTSAAVTQALLGLRRADAACRTFERSTDVSTLAGFTTPGGAASMCPCGNAHAPSFPRPSYGGIEPLLANYAPLPPWPLPNNVSRPVPWQQPLSPLVAGVALCLNVVREPEGTSAEDGALWPVGANPAQRLLMRARVSAGGSRLPPNHADLVESSFPPPWRRTGRRWLHFARFVCALDDGSFWQAARLLGLEPADASQASPIAVRTSAWSEALADHLLRRFGLMFCADPNGDREPGGGNGPDDRPAGGYPSNFGGRFIEQVFLFGARGPNARHLFGEAPPQGEPAHLYSTSYSPPPPSA